MNYNVTFHMRNGVEFSTVFTQDEINHMRNVVCPDSYVVTGAQTGVIVRITDVLYIDWKPADK